MSYGVMVAQQVLVLFVVVRIRLGQLLRGILSAEARMHDAESLLFMIN